MNLDPQWKEIEKGHFFLSEQNIETAEPGRELEAMVSLYVMDERVRHGYRWTPDGPVNDAWQVYNEETQSWRQMPHYDIDQCAALKVYFAALVKFGTASIFGDMEDFGRGAFFGDGPEGVVRVQVADWAVTARFPVAICKASLLAAYEDSKA